MPAESLDAPIAKHRSLAVLADDLRAAHEVVRGLRRSPVAHDQLLAAHQALLTAMESYSAALVARHLPVPPKLHGDLRLQRGIASQRGSAR